MDAPCCDVFELVKGKISRFDCHAEGSVIAKLLGLARFTRRRRAGLP
jgi:hypothetical protein